MRIFYAFWFFFCAGWGWLFASFPPQEGESVLNVALTFPLAIVSLGLLAFFALRSKGLPVENACLSINLRPWQQPLGVMQFVLITFLFTSAWGIGFGFASQSAALLIPIKILALAAGGLVGIWIACRVYRAHHAA